MAENKVNILITAKNEASKVFDEVGGSFLKVFGQGAAMGIAAGLTTQLIQGAGHALAEFGSFLKESVQMAGEYEHALNRLSATLARNHMEVKGNTEAIKEQANALQFQTGVSEEAIAEGYNRLILAGFDMARANETMKVALDAASASGLDLSSVLVALIKNSAGSEMMLTRLAASLGVVKQAGESSDDVLAKIKEKVAGSAQADMKDYAGAVKQAGEAWDDLKKAWGEVFLAPLEFAFRGVANAIRGSRDETQFWISSAASPSVLASDLTVVAAHAESAAVAMLKLNQQLGAQFSTPQFVALMGQLKNELLGLGNVAVGVDQKVGQFGPTLEAFEDATLERAARMAKLRSTEMDDYDRELKSIQEVGVAVSNVTQEMITLRYDGTSAMQKLRTEGDHASDSFVKMNRAIISNKAEETLKDIGKAAKQAALTGEDAGRGIGSIFMAIKNDGDVAAAAINAVIDALAKLILKSAFGQTFFGGLLGGFLSVFSFDDPTNDASARKWGYDFASNFGAGIQAYQTGFSAGPASFGPAVAVGGGGGGNVHNYFMGVTSDDFVRHDVIPGTGLASKRRQVTIVGAKDPKYGGSHVFRS